MSTLERHPQELDLLGAGLPGAVARIVPERVVPLGGPRGMEVTRTIPERSLPTIGAWCFLDQAGPAPYVSHLLPHPHIGLQTVSWLIEGTIMHRDTVGSVAEIRPGQLNLMTSGRGIAHSEFTLGDEPAPLHLLQLWIALPEESRWQAPHFEQHSDLPVASGDCWSATVLMGEFDGAVSPAATYSPLVGAEVRVEPFGQARLPLRPDFEHGVLAAVGEVVVEGTSLGSGPLLYLGADRETLTIQAGAEGAVVLLLGGRPLGEDLVMWWNFVGRTHEEIAEAREDWEAGADRFGPPIAHHEGARIPAPPLPTVRLTPRRRRPPEVPQ
ncbi:MAG TPA: pirin family protein [Microbacteriaceae bacterium]|nr:pirin family protein [Microbacteriaceae bacterium]